MKILITGSMGYVGRVLAGYFLRRGVSVCGLDRTPYAGLFDTGTYTHYCGTVTDTGFLERVFTDEEPTHVIHCAYLMEPLHDRKKNYTIDVTGTQNVFSCSNSTPSVKQFILMSSTSAYGAWPDNSLWLKEEEELRPRDYRYGIHKKMAEDYCNSANKREDLNLIILRMCTLVGPGYHKKGGVVSLLAKSPLLPKFNGRFCELQFIHEQDLTELIARIVHDPAVSGTFNLAPDSYAAVNELAPRPFYLNIPLPLARALIRVLWTLRLSATMPGAMDLSTYGIIADPGKIIKRYGFTFSHSTREAYFSALEERKARGTL